MSVLLKDSSSSREERSGTNSEGRDMESRVNQELEGSVGAMEFTGKWVQYATNQVFTSESFYGTLCMREDDLQAPNHVVFIKILICICGS